MPGVLPRWLACLGWPRRKVRSGDPPSTIARRNFKSVEKYVNILITDTAELYQGQRMPSFTEKNVCLFLLV